jgi:hypothetical protein
MKKRVYTDYDRKYYFKNKKRINKKANEKNNYFQKLGRYVYNQGLRIPPEKLQKNS